MTSNKIINIRRIAVSAVLVSSLVLMGSLMSVGVNAASSATVSANYKEVKVILDGSNQYYSQPAVILNGATLVPMRAIFEALGSTITLSGKTITAKKGLTIIVLTIGSTKATLNGKATTMTSPATLINNNTMVPLRFVAEALSAKVGWDAKTMTATITSDALTGVAQKGLVVNGIKVLYGKHTYASKNQAEYDAVLKIVNDGVKDGYEHVNADSQFWTYFERYFEGERYSDHVKDSKDYRQLAIVEGRVSCFKNVSLNKAEIKKVIQISILATRMVPNNDTEDPPFKPRSAYDSLILGVTDCDPRAQVYSAVFDSFSYNTAILASTGHADMIVQLGGKWFTTSGGDFMELDPAKAKAGGSYLMAQTTFGPLL